MVTLRGGAKHHDLTVDDGYRYSGPDIAGSISFLPAGCTRALRLHNVAWHWASITLSQHLLTTGGFTGIRPFSAAYDAFVLNMLAEMERVRTADNHLDPIYCDAMALSLTHYLSRRYWGGLGLSETGKRDVLPAWRLRRLTDYIHAHLAEEIRIPALANVVGLSEGHFHRAFRATTGQTPLDYINDMRIEAAKKLLATSDAVIGTVGPRVGYVSQSYFTRAFRARTGMTPGVYRREFASY